MLTREHLSKEEAMQVKDSCLHDTKERLMERASVIQATYSEADVKFRKHEEKSISKYRELEQKLDRDVRLASLRESD